VDRLRRRRQHERELQQRLAKEAESRNLMLASASHELRAPTHTLSLALQSMPRRRPGRRSAHGACDIAQERHDTLAELLSDVLDAARAGHESLRCAPAPSTCTSCSTTWPKPGGPPPHQGPGLRGRDRRRGAAHHQRRPAAPEARCSINLLSNAFKYTPGGRVDLRAERRPAEPGGVDGLSVTVADTGPGLSAELQARVFTPFVSAAAGAAPPPGEGSSGLGLAISRQLSELMGGRLTLSSQPGMGTQVTLWLPLQPSLPPSAVAPRCGVVLVCDDDDTSRLLLAHLLRGRGFAVEEVNRAEDALARCRRGGVAALVTDLEMPGLGGLGLLRALRGDSTGVDPGPALLVCSGDAVDDPDGPDTTGLADARLTKPVDLDVLLQALAAAGVRAGG
jgi:two-component system sensor histidine kinase EvgS